MIRVAFIGKGGSGKSTIAGTVARLIARNGGKVLALDVDTLPGLSFSLGLGRIDDAGLPQDLAERQEGKGWVLREPVSAEELVDRYALDAPDGVRFLQLGKLPGHVHPGSTTAFRHIVESFRQPGWSIVGDLAAGTRQGFFGWARFATHVGIVVEPTPASLLTARRLRKLTEMMPAATLGVIVNKVWGDGGFQGSVTNLGLPVWATLPYDEDVAAAEHEGLAPIDVAPRSKVVTAIGEFVRELQT